MGLGPTILGLWNFPVKKTNAKEIHNQELVNYPTFRKRKDIFDFNLGRATVAGRSPKPSTVFQCIPPIGLACVMFASTFWQNSPMKLAALNRMRSREQHFSQKNTLPFHPPICILHIQVCMYI